MSIGAERIDTGRAAVDIDRDRRLVLRHQQGDVEAFDELYRRYHERLVSFCARRVGDRDAAEELAQEAFVKALGALPRFSGERRFYPWMTVIAHRLCIDHHRRSARVEPTADVDAGLVEADHDAVFASVDRHHLADALARLAPRHREILELREERGWTYHQIAAHLDVPLTTVEALLHRARKALRREFLHVSGETRGRHLGVAALGGGAVARIRSWLAAAGPQRWAPALGTAAAGTFALGIVAGPFATHDPATAPSLRPPAPVIQQASVEVEPAAPPAPVVREAPAVVVTKAPTPGAEPGTGDPAPTPPPAADLPGANVYAGPDAVAWAEEQNDGQPVQATVADVVDVGLNPVQIVTDVLDPNDNGGNP